MASLKTVVSLGLFATAKLVAGHAAIVAATGDAGGSGMAIGIDSTTPRDGTRRRPFQQDSTRFRGDQEDTIGETIGAGNNNLEQGTSAILAETGDQLPQITPGGEVQMTLHQVNADGAGPYTCQINDDGTAQTWQSIQVTQSPPGDDSRDRDGEATDFPLTAAIPANQECTGTVAGEENVCLVRCMNGARAGPFGGVVPVQMAANANNGNTNTNTGNANTNTGNANTNTGNANTNTGNANTNTGNTNSNSNSNSNSNTNTGNTNTNTNSNSNSGTSNTDNDTTGSASSNNVNSNSNSNSNSNNADDDEDEDEEVDAADKRRQLAKPVKRNSTATFNPMLKRSPLLRRKLSPQDFEAEEEEC